MTSKIRDVVKSINSFEARIHMNDCSNEDLTFNIYDFGYTIAELRAEHSFFNCVTLQFKIFRTEYHTEYFAFAVSIKKTSDNSDNNKNFTLTVSSNSLGIKEKEFKDDDGTWRLINQTFRLNVKTFDISVFISMSSKPNLFANMYVDEFTDFKIKGKDGSVPFHRTVLAAISPVLENMLKGSWKEAKEGAVDLADTTMSTLQHFKKYIYKQELPEDDESLQQLLMLAKCYMVDCLEQACLMKLICNANTDNVCSLVEFSVINDMPELMVGIFNKFHKRGIHVVGVQANLLKIKPNKAQ